MELAELEEERQRAELDQPARVFELERVDPTQIATCLDRATVELVWREALR